MIEGDLQCAFAEALHVVQVCVVCSSIQHLSTHHSSALQHGASQKMLDTRALLSMSCGRRHVPAGLSGAGVRRTCAMSMPGRPPRWSAESTRKSVSIDSSRVSKKSCAAHTTVCAQRPLS